MTEAANSFDEKLLTKKSEGSTRMHEWPGSSSQVARLFGSPDVDQNEPQTAMCVDGTKIPKKGVVERSFCAVSDSNLLSLGTRSTARLLVVPSFKGS